MSEDKRSRTRADVEQVRRLIADSRTGCSTARGRLLDLCNSELIYYAGKILRQSLKSKCDPADIVQETVLEAYRDFDSFRGETLEQLLGWLRQMLRNNAYNMHRKYLHTDKRQVGREAAIDRDIAEQLIDQHDPEVWLETLQDRETVENGLDRLPAHMRQVILLRNRDGLTFSEIGAELGRSAEAARKLWSRSLARLQKEVARLRAGE